MLSWQLHWRTITACKLWARRGCSRNPRADAMPLSFWSTYIGSELHRASSRVQGCTESKFNMAGTCQKQCFQPSTIPGILRPLGNPETLKTNICLKISDFVRFGKPGSLTVCIFKNPDFTFWTFGFRIFWHFENLDLTFSTAFQKCGLPINTLPPAPRAQDGPGHIFEHIFKKWNTLKYPTPPTLRARPRARGWAGPGLGPWGGVGYLRVFHIFQNVFGNVKSWSSKCPNVQNQVSGFPKGRKMPNHTHAISLSMHHTKIALPQLMWRMSKPQPKNGVLKRWWQLPSNIAARVCQVWHAQAFDACELRNFPAQEGYTLDNGQSPIQMPLKRIMHPDFHDSKAMHWHLRSLASIFLSIALQARSDVCIYIISIQRAPNEPLGIFKGFSPCRRPPYS